MSRLEMAGRTGVMLTATGEITGVSAITGDLGSPGAGVFLTATGGTTGVSEKTMGGCLIGSPDFCTGGSEVSASLF